MKKAIKSAAIAALAISAITPVAASAATENVTDGIYTAEGFYSIAEFKKLSTAKKGAVLSSDNAALVVGGQALPASVILNGTDEEIDGSFISLAAYEEKYGVTFDSGKGFGEETEAGELKVESVSAINGTQVEIKFNQAIKKATSTQNLLDHLYFSLTDDKVIGSELSANNANGFTATLSKDGKSIIITADYENDFVIWKDTNTSTGFTALSLDGTNDVVKNKTIYVQARDLTLADGKLADTVEGSFVAKDTVAPKIKSIESEENANGTDTDVTVVFDEQVNIDDAKFYFDSNLLTTGTANATDNDLKLDDDGVTLTFTLPSQLLAEGNYEFEAVGVEDLAANTPAGDVLNTTLEIVEAPNDSVVPKLLSLDQKHDGAFVAVFNTPVETAKVTIKNLQNNTDEIYTISDTGATVVNDVYANGKGEQLTNDDDEITGYAYLINFAAATSGANVPGTTGVTGNYYAFEAVYKTSTQISRSVIVEDITSIAGTKGTKSTVTKTFITDTKAPVVAKSEYNDTDGTFDITFNDSPFDGDMKVDTSLNILVKLVVNGETKSATVQAPIAALNDTAGYTLAFDLSNETAFQNANGQLINGDYTFELPRGLVTDNKADDTPQYNGEYSSIKTTEVIKYTSGGDASVPQTANGLVEFNEDENAIYLFFVGKDIDAATATNPANYTIAGKTLTNASKIEFTSSKDLGADFPTPASTGLTLPNTDGALVKIFLEENTIVRDGQYTLTAKNVATNTGAKMLPASVSVAKLVDNTAPVLQSAVIVGDGQLELTFNESVTLDGYDVDPTVAGTTAARNLTIKLGSAAYSVATVAKKTGNDRVLVIHTKDTFGTPNSVTVELKRDQNNDMFITDAGGNEAVVKSVTASQLK